MKTALTIAGLALAVSGLAGCGGDDDSDAGGLPRDASSDDFCSAFTTFAKDIEEFAVDADASAAVEAMQGFSDDIREVGVPESASDEDAEGLEVTLDAIDDLDSDASIEEISSLDEDFSEAEKEKADAFGDYLEEECGDIE